MTGSQTEQGVVRVPLGTWNIDPTHSSLEFSIKHLMIATVRGRFRDFQGTIEAANHGFAQRRKVSPYERSKVMRRASTLLRERENKIAQI